MSSSWTDSLGSHKCKPIVLQFQTLDLECSLQPLPPHPLFVLKNKHPGLPYTQAVTLFKFPICMFLDCGRKSEYQEKNPKSPQRDTGQTGIWTGKFFTAMQQSEPLRHICSRTLKDKYNKSQPSTECSSLFNSVRIACNVPDTYLYLLECYLITFWPALSKTHNVSRNTTNLALWHRPARHWSRLTEHSHSCCCYGNTAEVD